MSHHARILAPAAGVTQQACIQPGSKEVMVSRSPAAVGLAPAAVLSCPRSRGLVRVDRSRRGWVR